MNANEAQATPPELSSRWVEFLLEHQIVGLFASPITLASGNRSRWYVNWRTISEDVFLLEQTVDLLLESLERLGLRPDTLYGVPEGASKLAVLSQFKWARRAESYGPGSHRLAMGRGKPKEHGAPQDRLFLGKPEGEVLVLEDVTTTGGSLLRTVGQLQQLDVQVMAALSLTDRQLTGASVREQLADLGVPFYAMCEARELLPRLLEQIDVDEAQLAGLREECPFLNESQET